MLPKLEYTTYDIKIPSTGKDIVFRPYTVGEEKILLTALASEDVKDITKSLKDLIKHCCFGDYEIDDLTSYDVEYIFIKLRSQSVSNVIEMQFRNQKCPENNDEPCEKSVRIMIPLEDAECMIINPVTENWETVDNKKHKLKETIQITEDVGVQITHPSMDDAAVILGLENEIDQRNQMVVASIQSIYDKETVYTDYTEEELKEFVEGIPVTKKLEILEFVDKIPVLRYETKFKCKKCGFEEDISFEGLQDFFV